MKRPWLGVLALLIACGGMTASKPDGWNVGKVTYCGECRGYNKIEIAVEATPPDPDIALLELVTVTCEPGTQPLGLERGAFTVTPTSRAPDGPPVSFDGGELVLTECSPWRVQGSFRLDRDGQASISGTFDVAPHVMTQQE